MARHKKALAQLSLGLGEQLDAQARAGRIDALIDAPLQIAQTSLQLRLLTVYGRVPPGPIEASRRPGPVG